MNYKLNVNDNEEVEVIVPAGSDFVKFTMPVGQAKGVIESSEIEASDKFEGFEIFADGKYFAGTVKAEKSQTSDEPKEDKSFKKDKWQK